MRVQELRAQDSVEFRIRAENEQLSPQDFIRRVQQSGEQLIAQMDGHIERPQAERILRERFRVLIQGWITDLEDLLARERAIPVLGSAR